MLRQTKTGIPFMSEQPPHRPNPFLRAGSDSALTEDAWRVRVLRSDRAWAWLRTGWKLFLASPVSWLGIMVVWILMIVVQAALPPLALVSNLIAVVFVGGIMLGVRDLAEGGRLHVGALWAGFRSHLRPLLWLGFYYVVATVVLALLFLLGGLMLFDGAALSGEPAGGGWLLIALCLVLLVPVLMAMWFAPTLVALQDMAPREALRLSLRACARNMWVLTVYSLMLTVLALFATLFGGLGWFVLFPVLFGSAYASYCEILLGRTALPEDAA